LKLKIKDFSSALNNTIEFDFYVDTIDDVVLKDKLHIVGTAISDGSGKVEVSGKYSTKIEVQCVRCLKNIEEDLTGEFTGTFLDESAYRQYMKNLKVECEIDSNEIYDEIIDGEIDLVNLVREYIILDLPPYPQCDPECEDDSEIEKYSNHGIDSRWQQLLQIKN